MLHIAIDLDWIGLLNMVKTKSHVAQVTEYGWGVESISIQFIIWYPNLIFLGSCNQLCASGGNCFVQGNRLQTKKCNQVRACVCVTVD